MSTTSTVESKGLQGTVKWFSNRKGFGFIASDALKEEIFVHQTGIVTNGQFRTLQESSSVMFDVEKEDGTGKLKAVNVTNVDGTPISPPPRQPRRVRPAGGDAPKKETAPPDKTTSDDEEAKENKDVKKGGRKGRNVRNKPKKEGTNDNTAPETPAPTEKEHDKTPRDPPFHAVLTPEVKKKAETDRKLSLGQRTTIDIAFGPDVRIKLGQGGYTAVCLKTAVIGEGTFTCNAEGMIMFTWTCAIECTDGAWKKCATDALLKSFSLVDEKVGPVGPSETAATLWGEDKPDPKEAFEANGFQMRRVVLTRPPGRFRRGGHAKNNNRGPKKSQEPAI